MATPKSVTESRVNFLSHEYIWLGSLAPRCAKKQTNSFSPLSTVEEGLALGSKIFGELDSNPDSITVGVSDSDDELRDDDKLDFEDFLDLRSVEEAEGGGKSHFLLGFPWSRDPWRGWLTTFCWLEDSAKKSWGCKIYSGLKVVDRIWKWNSRNSDKLPKKGWLPQNIRVKQEWRWLQNLRRKFYCRSDFNDSFDWKFFETSSSFKTLAQVWEAITNSKMIPQKIIWFCCAGKNSIVRFSEIWVITVSTAGGAAAATPNLYQSGNFERPKNRNWLVAK